MAKAKFKWTDTEDIAFRLIDEHPSVNPLKLRFTELHKYVTSLPEFADNPKGSSEAILESIQMKWYEERQDMEDELGPLEDEGEEESDELDEDDYREDRMVDDDALLGEEDDDDEEDDLDDGFQEEGDRDDER